MTCEVVFTVDCLVEGAAPEWGVTVLEGEKILAAPMCDCGASNISFDGLYDQITATGLC